MSVATAAPRPLQRVGTLRLSARLIPLGVFGVTIGLRLFHLRQAYDVFLDESIYSRIAAGVAVDGRVVFGAYPFYLHGPLSFYLQAGVIHLFAVHGTAVDVIYALRVLNVLIAGAVAVLVFTIVRSVASRTFGLLAAALFAFDPFIVSFDSRLFLETLATLWVLLGFCLLMPLAGEREPGARQLRAPVRRRYALAGGFAFGLALLTKETSAPLYVLPLLWCVALGRPLRRSSAASALLTAALTYAPYPLIAVLTGGGGQFVEQKFSGVERLLGIVQTTGFNRPGAPSLLSRVSADLGTFLMTYVLIALGALAAVWLYRRGNTRQRLVATWGFGALAMLAFQTTQGTIEEQMFYYLVVPSIVLVASALSLIWADRPAPPEPGSPQDIRAAIAPLTVHGAHPTDAVPLAQDVPLAHARLSAHHAPPAVPEHSAQPAHERQPAYDSLSAYDPWLTLGRRRALERPPGAERAPAPGGPPTLERPPGPGEPPTAQGAPTSVRRPSRAPRSISVLQATSGRRALILVALVAIAAFDLATWIGAHTRRDTAIASAVAWTEEHIPLGSRVAPLADGIQFLLPADDLLFNPEAGEVSPSALRAAGTQLVITSSLQAEQGYSAASPALIAWLRSHARERFSATGASTGTVIVWQLAPLPLAAPPGPQRLSPRAPISVGSPTYRA